SMVERKIGHKLITEIDWSKWVTHPNFKSQHVAVQNSINEHIMNKNLNGILNGPDGLCEVYTARTNLQAIMKQKIRKIVLAFDPANSIKDGGRDAIELAGWKFVKK